MFHDPFLLKMSPPYAGDQDLISGLPEGWQEARCPIKENPGVSPFPGFGGKSGIQFDIYKRL